MFAVVPTVSWAASLESVTQDIEVFAKSPDSRFSPATTARVQAVLGAALVANRKHNTQSLQDSLQTALSMLASARKQARDFKEKYKDVLVIEQAAKEVSGHIPDSNLMAAEQSLQRLVQAFERGNLNQSVNIAIDTKNAFKSVLDSKLPPLLEKTDAAILMASRAGAERYTPQAYKAAQTWLGHALDYTNNLNKNWPRHPGLGLKLANAAHDLALQVKEWRKHPASFEQLVLRARQDRVQIAQALGMDVDGINVDVDTHVLLQRIHDMRHGFAQEKQIYQNDIAALKQRYADTIKKKIAALKDEMVRNQSQQVGALKDAFRVKLERETFETRRQQQLRKLFKKGEVNILANLDGSLLVRLSALQFAPGKTTIARKFFDLLSRLKSGLALYPDRKIAIEGHTDNKGDAKANRKLSLKRAEGIRDFLIAAGMDNGRLKALGYGEVRPIASNDYERGRAMNRRIDIIIQASH